MKGDSKNMNSTKIIGIMTLLLMAPMFFFAKGKANAQDKKVNLQSIVDAFQKAGFKGKVKKGEKQMLDFFSKIVAPGKAIGMLIFMNSKHPCMIIQFDSKKSANKYITHPMTKHGIRQKGKNSVTKKGTFVLGFDEKRHISKKLISIFKRKIK